MVFIFIIKAELFYLNHNKKHNIFLELLSQYSMQRLAQDGQVMAVMQVPIILQNECMITPVNFNIEKVECGTVLCRELFKDKEY